MELELIKEFGDQVGTERSSRLIEQIENNTPPLLMSFFTQKSVPVNADEVPTTATHPDQQRAAKAAVALKIILDLQAYVDSLNVPNGQTNNTTE